MMWQTWRHLRTLRTLTLLTLTLLGGTAIMPAAPAGGDRIDELRQALRQSIRDPKNEEEIQYRKTNLDKRIKALRLNELRRALKLEDWRDLYPEEEIARIDAAARQELIDRLSRSLRDILQRGGTAAKLAAITEIAEIGTEIRAGNLSDEDAKKMKPEERRRWARGGLARQFTPDLVRLTREGDPAVRAFAARALGKINADPESASAALGQLLQNGTVAERRAAADGLLDMLQTIVLVLKSRSATGVEINREDIVLADQHVVSAAGRGLGDSDATVRKTCIEAIRQGAGMLYEQVIELPEAQRQTFPPPGRKLTENEQAELKAYRESVEAELRQLLPVAQALAGQVKAVLGATADPDPVIRLLACHTLEEMGQARIRLVRKATSVPDYSKAKNGGNEDKKGRAPGNGRGTFQLTTRPVAQADKAKDEDPLTADPLGKPLLDTLDTLATRATSDEKARVRLAAVDAIETLGPAAAPAVPTLVRALRDGNLFVRWASARVIGKIGTAEVDPALTVPPLARLLDDLDLDVDLAAATALTLYGPAAAPAVPVLARATGGGDPERRVAAINALRSIGDDAKPAIPAITAALANNDARVRRAAADALGQFGPDAASATDALETALSDPEPDVRKAAADALLAVTAGK